MRGGKAAPNQLFKPINTKLYVSVEKALVKTRRVGGSLVVALPQDIVEAKKIKAGEIVEITVNKLPVYGFGALRGIVPFTHDDELKPRK